MSIPNNLLPFLKYTFLERIKLLFHSDGDNQFLEGSDEIDEAIDSDEEYAI